MAGLGACAPPMAHLKHAALFFISFPNILAQTDICLARGVRRATRDKHGSAPFSFGGFGVQFLEAKQSDE